MAEESREYEAESSPAYLQRVQSLLADLRYGSVTLVVQDGKVVQIEKHEKIRLR